MDTVTTISVSTPRSHLGTRAAAARLGRDLADAPALLKAAMPVCDALCNWCRHSRAELDGRIFP
jgi:hypothetical protein